MWIEIERVENLIRVMSELPPHKFNIRAWYDADRDCGCAIGWAVRDAYFIEQGLKLTLGGDILKTIAQFFSIKRARAEKLFTRHVGHSSQADMMAALRVLLLEKQAQQVCETYEIADTQMELVQ